MNCTEEEASKIIEEHWEENWEHIKSIPLPDKREFEITGTECLNELKSLRNNKLSNKSNSKIIHKFFPSMAYASKGGKPSPMEFWKKIQDDSELFKKFYKNRLMCSDWYNEKNGENRHYLYEGHVPDFIFSIGVSSSQKAPFVSYFKPSFAVNLIKQYLNEFDTIFDPCCGYGGRLLGALACQKSFVGYDINDTTIVENANLVKWIKENNSDYISGLKIALSMKDSFKETGKFSCMLTCPPYSDSKGKQIEIWQNSKGEKIECQFTCDEVIDILLKNYDCEKYVIVVDDSISKYRDYIADKHENVNYIGARKGKLTNASYNFEAIVVITKEQRDKLIQG